MIKHKQLSKATLLIASLSASLLVQCNCRPEKPNSLLGQHNNHNPQITDEMIQRVRNQKEKDPGKDWEFLAKKLEELKNGINNEISKGNFKDANYTALHYAVLLGDPLDITQALIAGGADVTIEALFGFTPLDLAINQTSPIPLEIAKILVNKAPKELINRLDSNGQSLLYKAIWKKEGEAAKILLTHPGIDINIPANPNNYTPLHVAVIKEQEEIVKILLQKGASRTEKDNNGRTPLDLAQLFNYHNSHNNIIDLLNNHP